MNFHVLHPLPLPCLVFFLIKIKSSISLNSTLTLDPRPSNNLHFLNLVAEELPSAWLIK